MYEYYAKLIRVVDGDTVYLDVDLGCDVHITMSCRLFGINAPEMSTPEGREAKVFVDNWFHVDVNASVVLHTIKDRKEKYGRYLAIIERPNIDSSEARYLAADLMAAGLAVEYLP